MSPDSFTLWLALYAIPSEQIFFFLDFDGPGNPLLTSAMVAAAMQTWLHCTTGLRCDRVHYCIVPSKCPHTISA